MQNTSDQPATPLTDATAPPPTLNPHAQTARENGAKSRGPTTPQGKAASSRNATKHGLLARTVVLPHESQKRFARLLTALRAEIRPVGEIEKHLVESMAVARWRRLRAWGFERAIIGFEVKQRTPGHSEIAGENDTTKAAVGVNRFTDQSRFLALLNVSEGRYERQYDRALKRLLELRAAASPSPRDAQ